MERMPTSPTEEEATNVAMLVINDFLEKYEGEVDPETFITALKAHVADESPEVQRQVESYIGVLRSSVKTDVIAAFKKGKGGEFDGSRTAIGATALMHTGDLSDLKSRATEISDHELFHEKHDHTAPIQTAPDAKGDTLVRVGSVNLTHEDVVETVTMDATGTKHVSDRYKKMKEKTESALSGAGLKVDHLNDALDKKDMSLISDETRTMRRRTNNVFVQPSLGA